MVGSLTIVLLQQDLGQNRKGRGRFDGPRRYITNWRMRISGWYFQIARNGSSSLRVIARVDREKPEEDRDERFASKCGRILPRPPPSY